MTPLDIISLEQAKEWLRVDFPDDDDKITELIYSAISWIEGYTGLFLYNREFNHQITYDERCIGKVHIFGQPNLTLVSIDGETEDLPNVYGGQIQIRSDMQNIVYSIGFLGLADVPQPLITAAKKFLTLQYEETTDGEKEVPSEIRRLIDQYRLFTWF